MKFIIGKKLDMTQVWQGDNVIGATRVQAGPCTVVQIKGDDKDGYSAVQVGFGKRQKKNIKKPQQGHMKDLDNFGYLREFRISLDTPKDAKEHQLKRGDKINASTFEVGDNIQIKGVSKGKGFQGVVKRHGFHGQDKTHGTKDQLRMPGSIGSTGPAHVFKGMRMPGRMGCDQVTVKNSEVVEVDKENNILFVKGAVPGARNSLVLISGKGELMITRKHSASPQNTENTETQSLSRTPIREHKNIKTPSCAKVSAGKQKDENKEENIEKVVVEAAEKVGDIKEIKKEEVKNKDSKEEKNNLI